MNLYRECDKHDVWAELLWVRKFAASARQVGEVRRGEGMNLYRVDRTQGWKPEEGMLYDADQDVVLVPVVGPFYRLDETIDNTKLVAVMPSEDGYWNEGRLIGGLVEVGEEGP